MPSSKMKRFLAVALFSLIVVSADSIESKGIHRDMQVQSNSFFTGSFSIVKANQLPNATIDAISLGSYLNGATIDINPFKPNDLSLYIHTTVSNFTKVTLEYDGKLQSEGSAPYAIKGNSGNKFTAEPYLLSVGLKSIVAKAYYSTNIVGEMTYLFRTIDSSLGSPSTKPPTTAPQNPTLAPNKPTLAPNKPTLAPNNPTLAPNNPTLAPNNPTLMPVSTSPNLFFTGSFVIVKADQLSNATIEEISLGNYVNGATIDLNLFKQNNLALFIQTTVTNFTKVTLEYDGRIHSEGSPPYAINGNVGNQYSSEPYLLTVGSKTIVAKAYYNADIVGEMTYTFRTVDSSGPANSPTIAPRTPTLSPNNNNQPIMPAQPAFQPTLMPISTQPDFLLNGTWRISDMNASITARHEACFVMAGRLAVLMGGRGKRRPDIYNPVTRTWKQGVSPPNEILLHHMQCVAVQNKVWLAAAWSGGFPQETNVPVLYVYDPILDKWETKTALADPRRRGSAAVVAVGELIYIAFGNRGGHEQADFAISLPYLDVYNTTDDTWRALPDGNFPRDHTGAAVVNGRICVGGGRNGGMVGWPNVSPTECYNIATGTWSVEMNILQNRAGSAYGTSCDGKLLMAGGEGSGKAWKNFEMFDGTKWTRLADLNIAVHGTGLAVDCVCNAIYIASGNGQAGGGMELTSFETFSLDHQPCLA